MGVRKMLEEGVKKEKEAISKEKAESKSESKNNRTIKKNRGGRPKNETIGLHCRKQYTLTLKEEDYKEFLDTARSEDISFAKFMEKAAKEYIARTKKTIN